jgi:flagellar motor protein MotB
MLNRSDLRKEAYQYILERLCKLSTGSDNAEPSLTISLHEINLLKEGTADPSASLVAALKQLFRDSVAEEEINAHLVVPFEKQEDEVEVKSAIRRNP